MSDPSMTLEVSPHVFLALGVVVCLPDGLCAPGHVQPGAEGRVESILEIEDLVPGGEVFEEVREMHVRPVCEVPARAEICIAERLEVRDPRRAEPRLLGRREAEEQLCPVGDEL